MGRFYLARYIGTGTASNPFRPAGADDAATWDAIDFRPDPTVADGRALLWTPDPLPLAPLQRTVLTDDPDDRSLIVRTRIASELVLNLDEEPFRWVVMSLLLRHGDDANPSRWDRLRAGPGGYQVWLGGLLAELPSSIQALSASDNFNRADESLDASANWVEVEGNLSVVSNEVDVVTTSAARAVARWATDCDTDNNYAQARITGTPGSNSPAPWCRMGTQATNPDGYGVRHRSGTSDVQLLKVVSGSLSQVSTQAQAGSAPYTLRIEAEGSTLRAYFDGVLVKTSTDTGVTTGKRIGVRCSDVAHTWDDFAGGDLVTGVSAAAALTLPALTQAAVGDATVAAAGSGALPALAQAATGEATVAAAAAAILPQLEQDAAALAATTGTAAQTLPALTQQAEAETEGVSAATAQTLPTLDQSATAVLITAGQISGVLPALVQAVEAEALVTAIAAGVLPVLTQAAAATSGAVDVNATSTATVTTPATSAATVSPKATSITTATPKATSVSTVSDG